VFRYQLLRRHTGWSCTSRLRWSDGNSVTTHSTHAEISLCRRAGHRDRRQRRGTSGRFRSISYVRESAASRTSWYDVTSRLWRRLAQLGLS